jgi:hypothetical protein
MWQCKKCREQIEAALEVCWNCGTSRDGVEDPSFQKADDMEGPPAGGLVERAEALALDSAPKQHQVVRATDVAPRPPREGDRNVRCPRCGSSALDHGSMDLDVKFHRSKQWISTGWQVQAFVCLDCGLPTQHLSPGDLEKLRARNA